MTPASRLLRPIVLLIAAHVVALTANADDGVIKLGHYGSMSGSKAAFGTSTDRAIRLAIAEANARGGVLGRNIEIFTEDDQSNTDQVLPALLSLLDRREVDVVLGEVSSTFTLIGAPECQSRRVPMITPSSVAAAITKKGDYIFRACFIDVYQGRAAAVFAFRDLKARKAALLVDQSSDYALGYAQAFRALFESMGGQLVAERKYREGDKDFKAQLSAIQQANPDVLVFPAMYNDVPNMARQARGLGMAIPLVGGDGWDAAETARDGGASVEGSFFVTHYSPDQPTGPVKAFQKAYADRYGEQPDGMAALGYDAARMVLDAIERAGSVDKKAIRDALAVTKNFPGVTGTITMGTDRNPEKSATIVQIRDGGFHYFATIEPFDIVQALTLRGGSRSAADSSRWTPAFIGQQIINGLSLGAIYGLIALGYTIVYGILRLINFAHGDVFMLGPVCVIAAAGAVLALPGGPIARACAAVAISLAVCGFAAFALERFAYRPLRRPYSWRVILALGIVAPLALWAAARAIGAGDNVRDRLLVGAAIGLALYAVALALGRFASGKGIAPLGRMAPLITAIGASLMLEYTTQLPALFGNRPRGFPTEIVGSSLGESAGQRPIHFSGLIVERIDILTAGATAIVVLVLTWVVRRTRPGLAMRAVSTNPDVALLMGVDRDRVIAFSFTLGGLLAGVAGILWAVKYPQIDPLMGIQPGLKAFVAAVLGGIGSLPGAVVGGLIMGVSEAFLAASPYSEHKDAVAFLILIGVLLARPAGLLGRAVPEKV